MSERPPPENADDHSWDEYRRHFLPGAAGEATVWMGGRPATGPTSGPPAAEGWPGTKRALCDGQYLVTRSGARLRVVGLLNSGGMGEVYVAHDERRDAEVALKVPRHLDGREGLARAFFEREKEAHERLRGAPHIVSVIDGNRPGDQPPFLVMEYIWGKNLEETLRATGPLSVGEAVRIGREIALALQAAHAAGVVHRDLKPANVMLTETGQARVLDWGLARFWHQQPTSRSEVLTLLGTDHFLAPEQARAPARVDGRADLYSLGCTLYFLLLGYPPFAECKSQIELIQAHCSYPRPSLRRKRPDVPLALEALVHRLMEPQPERRIASAGQLLRALDDLALDAQPRVARPATGRLAILLAPLALLLALLPPLGRPTAAPPARPDVAVANPFDEPTPAMADAPGAPLHASLRIERWRGPIGPGRRYIGPIGNRHPRAYLEDRIRVFTTSNQAAYAYLLALLPDGGEQLCWPADETTAPPRAQSVLWPAPESSGWALRQANGMHGFLLILSARPLPPYRTFRERHGPTPWATFVDPGCLEWDGAALRRMRPGAQPLTIPEGEVNPFRGACRFWDSLPGIDRVYGRAFLVLERRRETDRP